MGGYGDQISMKPHIHYNWKLLGPLVIMDGGFGQFSLWFLGDKK
jgi:hypothetical protein